MARKCARTFSIVVEKGKKSILDVGHLLPGGIARSVLALAAAAAMPHIAPVILKRRPGFLGTPKRPPLCALGTGIGRAAVGTRFAVSSSCLQPHRRHSSGLILLVSWQNSVCPSERMQNSQLPTSLAENRRSPHSLAAWLWQFVSSL